MLQKMVDLLKMIGSYVHLRWENSIREFGVQN